MRIEKPIKRETSVAYRMFSKFYWYCEKQDINLAPTRRSFKNAANFLSDTRYRYDLYFL